MYKIMTKEKYNILKNVSLEQYRTIRKLAIPNILATDMKRHFEILKLCEIKISKFVENNEPLSKQ